MNQWCSELGKLRTSLCEQQWPKVTRCVLELHIWDLPFVQISIDLIIHWHSRCHQNEALETSSTFVTFLSQFFCSSVFSVGYDCKWICISVIIPWQVHTYTNCGSCVTLTDGILMQLCLTRGNTTGHLGIGCSNFSSTQTMPLFCILQCRLMLPPTTFSLCLPYVQRTTQLAAITWSSKWACVLSFALSCNSRLISYSQNTESDFMIRQIALLNFITNSHVFLVHDAGSKLWRYCT